jgi:hypothetical protein
MWETNFHNHIKQATILYYLIFTFLGSKLEDKKFCTELQQPCQNVFM